MAIFKKKSTGNVEEVPCKSEFNFLTAIEAHVRWKIRLEAYINGTSEEVLDPSVISQDNQCALGKWIYGEGGKKYGKHPKFHEIKGTHASFHQCAGDVVRLVDNGELDIARKMLCSGDYYKASHRVTSNLAKLSLELDEE